MEKIDIVEQRIVDISLDLMKILLKDKTTGKFILWATDDYEQFGDTYKPSQEILPDLIIRANTEIIQPRVMKSQAEQFRRTKDKAEVFTPSWICNQQNNLIDDAWFGRTDVFNKMDGKKWTATTEKIIFPDGKSWQKYVDARRMEISCGEAPYLVSRYDAVTGAAIPIPERIGLLDRKLRIVNENTVTMDEWEKWVTRAYQSIYGYEYQGDNVLLARENLLLTYIDYYEDRFKVKPPLMQLKKIATVISWNIWQMDGITMTAPLSEVPPLYQQLSIFDMPGMEDEQEPQETQMEAVFCKIFDWRADKSIEFRSLRNGGH